ncbi:MAG: UvrD-helicase domain-containing protein, partial [Ilumatobacteraceae bacterium]
MTAGSLEGLNPDQLDAVVHRGSPLLVVAGAGSGKTRVLTHRIAHLIDEGVHPMQILAITFTNKAAGEMRERVAVLVGPVAQKMWVSTFHAACVRILRANADRLGYPRTFSIYDQADAQRLTGYVIRDLGLDAKRFAPRAVHATISLWKNELIGPDQATAKASNIFERKHADVYREYQARLLRAGAMDFDDLLTQTVELFRKHPDVLQSYRERFKHILIDEYQDTNLAQNELAVLLAADSGEITAVGDENQSIYGFRGADVRNINQLEDSFENLTTIVLDQNYRSTQVILDAANAVISHNAARRPKELWSELGQGDRIVRYHADDEHDEASWVVRTLHSLHETDAQQWREIAIFYRTNAQARVVEESLIRLGVPYKVVGGTRFYDRREIKDAMAYLRAAVNPADEVSVKRVLNVPKRGVGDTSVGKLDAFAAAETISFNRDVRPILSENCFYCHGPDKSHRKAKLRLDIREAALAKEAFVPGNPDESALIERIFTADEDELMPPADSHKKLTARDKDVLKQWIAQGATYQLHWSYEKPVKATIQAGKNAVDVLVQQRLDELHLKPSAPADRRTLM